MSATPTESQIKEMLRSLPCECVIAEHAPEDGREWDCQCARCGSSVSFEACDACGGDGVYGHDCGEDTCCCRYPEDNVPCDTCEGKGSFGICISTPEYCDANPQSGRENIERGQLEWYTFDSKQ